MTMTSKKIKYIASATLLVLGLVIFFLSTRESHISGGADRHIAERVSRRVEQRWSKLESYAARVLEGDCSEWMDVDKLPSDMVVYRYCSDTLQAWCNEFSVYNDNLGPNYYFRTLSDPRRSPYSRLADVSEEMSFVNMGPKWYLTRTYSHEDVKVIVGLEVINTQLLGPKNNVNTRLGVPEDYNVRPLSYDGGVPVSVKGVPLFKIRCEDMSGSTHANTMLLWLALTLALAAAVLYLSAHPSLGRFGAVSLCMSAAMLAFYIWGRTIHGQFTIFSPVLYAGNEVLYSLGAVVIINLAIMNLSFCLCLCRASLCRKLRTRTQGIVALSAAVVAVIGILFYTQSTLRSIILNSGISLELYKLSEISFFGILVYASFITMLISVPLILQAVQPAVGRTLGIRYDALSLNNRIGFALLIAVFMVSSSSIIGFRKEQGRMEALANRLSFDRDIALEVRLKVIEPQIADDMIISALSVFNNTASTIQNRISDYYFSRNEQDYSISVYVFNNTNNSRAAANQYNAILKDGVPISDNSRFLYVKRDGGHSYYVGVFLYLIEGSGLSRVVVRLESRDTRGNKGYAGIFGITPPGKVAIPAGYSYARYEGSDLKSFGGAYAYPTRLEGDFEERLSRGARHMSYGGYTHFFTTVGDRETVVLSRPNVSVFTYIVSGTFIAILAYLVLSLLVLRRRKDTVLYGKSYFRSRISGILLTSLVLTLVVMASVSVFFVYNRNDSNMHSVMSDKINSITMMVEAGSHGVFNGGDVRRRELRDLIERIGGDTCSDITIYTASGRLLLSTTPMVFNRQLLGQRINGDAYRQIVYEHRRYCLQRERVGNVSFYSMYAPIRDDGGDLVGIICSPYNDDNYDFEEDAITHSMTILSLFLVFLLASMLIVSRVVDKMFRPLSEMSSKMNAAGLGDLDYIEYDRDDEISLIVQAYNRMVGELKESSKKLAQAERDKAWNEMARQVAHEIKNPLTPMKLQIQRLIRLRQKEDPSWLDKFDEASKVLLDHIEILTETANEFSAFAKPYAEEVTTIRLDLALQEEITMFNNKDNVRFDFLGLEGVSIVGPKPQLTRVFVNLINNAVQAIGDRPDGHIVISLRNSSGSDAFYDVVFEDNGPGVSEENVAKLFTPNFTTKNGGSGLGLALSRSVLERCGASIRYNRSFSLGGACFTISYPKKPAEITSA